MDRLSRTQLRDSTCVQGAWGGASGSLSLSLRGCRAEQGDGLSHPAAQSSDSDDVRKMGDASAANQNVLRQASA